MRYLDNRNTIKRSLKKGCKLVLDRVSGRYYLTHQNVAHYRVKVSVAREVVKSGVLTYIGDLGFPVITGNTYIKTNKHRWKKELTD